MNHQTKELSQIQVYQGRVVNIVHRCVKFSSGETIEYEITNRPDIALIIPILESGELVVIYQYRAALDKDIWEFPAGSVKVGESPIDAAMRELEEEVGYKANDFKLIGEFHTSPHFSNEKVYVYVAINLYFTQVNHQEEEFISIYKLFPSEFEAKYLSGEILDGKTIIAYQFLINQKL